MNSRPWLGASSGLDTFQNNYYRHSMANNPDPHIDPRTDLRNTLGLGKSSCLVVRKAAKPVDS